MNDKVKDLPTDQITARYLALRDKVKALDEEHTARLRPYRDIMEALEVEQLRRLDEQGIQSMKTRDGRGTAYISEPSRVVMQDWNAFLSFLVETENWHMLAKSANKTAIEEFLEEEEALPPGVSLKYFRKVNFRK